MTDRDMSTGRTSVAGGECS